VSLGERGGGGGGKRKCFPLLLNCRRKRGKDYSGEYALLAAAWGGGKGKRLGPLVVRGSDQVKGKGKAGCIMERKESSQKIFLICWGGGKKGGAADERAL